MVQLHLQPAFFPGPARFSVWTCAVPAVYQWHKWWCFIIYSFCVCRWLCSVPSGSDKRELHKTCQHYHNGQNCRTCPSMWRSVHTCVSPWSGTSHHKWLQHRWTTGTQGNKYIGVTVSNDLSWNTHAQKIQTKTLPAVGKCDQKVKDLAYKQLVRPQLDYASCTWNPHLQKTLTSLRTFNVRLLDLCTGENPVWPLCIHPFAWTPCKTNASLVSVRSSAKIHHMHVNITMPSELCPSSVSFALNAHNIPDLISSIISLFADWTATCTTCSPRSIRIWNTLPNNALTLSSLARFPGSSITHHTEHGPQDQRCCKRGTHMHHLRTAPSTLYM